MIINCKRCFKLFQCTSLQPGFCQSCVNDLFKMHSKTYPWLADPNNWKTIQCRYHLPLEHSLERLQTLIETYRTYGRQMKNYLPETHLGNCYLCPEQLPSLDYPEPICPNCIEVLNSLIDPVGKAKTMVSLVDAEPKSANPQQIDSHNVEGSFEEVTKRFSFRKAQVSNKTVSNPEALPTDETTSSSLKDKLPTFTRLSTERVNPQHTIDM